MAAFDDQLAVLQARLAAATKVLEDHPEVALKVADAMASAVPDPVKAEEEAQDAARANALARTLDAARAKLPAPTVKRDRTLEGKDAPDTETPIVKSPTGRGGKRG